MATQVNARARDFNFTLDLDESCNCCRRRKRVHDDLHIYIHSNGRTEPFSLKKADSSTGSLSRCIVNLSTVIQALAELEGEDPEEAKREFEGQTGLRLNPHEPQELSVRDLKAINAAIAHIFTKESTDVGT